MGPPAVEDHAFRVDALERSSRLELAVCVGWVLGARLAVLVTKNISEYLDTQRLRGPAPAHIMFVCT